MTYISGEDIEAFCGSCRSRKVLTSKKSGRLYDFCFSYQSPCYKVITLCQHEKSVVLQQEIARQRQKTLDLY